MFGANPTETGRFVGRMKGRDEKKKQGRTRGGSGTPRWCTQTLWYTKSSSCILFLLFWHSGTFLMNVYFHHVLGMLLKKCTWNLSFCPVLTFEYFFSFILGGIILQLPIGFWIVATNHPCDHGSPEDFQGHSGWLRHLATAGVATRGEGRRKMGRLSPFPKKGGEKKRPREAWNTPRGKYHLGRVDHIHVTRGDWICLSGFWLISFLNIPPGKEMEEQLRNTLGLSWPLTKTQTWWELARHLFSLGCNFCWMIFFKVYVHDILWLIGVVYKGPWGLAQPHFNHRPKIPQEGQIKNCHWGFTYLEISKFSDVSSIWLISTQWQWRKNLDCHIFSVWCIMLRCRSKKIWVQKKNITACHPLEGEIFRKRAFMFVWNGVGWGFFWGIKIRPQWTTTGLHMVATL